MESQKKFSIAQLVVSLFLLITVFGVQILNGLDSIWTKLNDKS